MRTAIAHEWIASRSGSEKVFEALSGIFPNADLYALTADPSVSLELGGRRVKTSFLDRSSILRDRRDLSLPLMPMAWRRAGRRATYDLVVTSSHAAAKGFWPGRAAVHLCYCHTPMRYAWLSSLDDRGHGGAMKATARAAARWWDRRSAGWVDSFAANSHEVADRIQRFYGRHARVIAPPVEVDFFMGADGAARSGGLAISRWIPYKRIDLAIQASVRAGVPLTVAGSGPEEPRLRELAAGHERLIRFEFSPSDDRLRELYKGAEFVMFPAEEDFGIVPIEAQAAGTPVIALARGGTRDTVLDGITGVLVRDQTVEAFAAGIERLRCLSLDPERCRENAARFGPERFRSEVLAWVSDACEVGRSAGGA